MPKSLKRIQVRWDDIFVKALLAVAALCSSCSHETTTTPPTPVRVTSVGTSEGSGGIRYSANINAFTQVTLAFKSGGYVDNIAQRRGVDGRIRVLQVGDRVMPDEVLAHIRESDYLDKVNSAKAQLAQVTCKSEFAFGHYRAELLLAAATSQWLGRGSRR
jgi:multidrug efflux pump subunit AcrA (membrane-fusion protein)